MKERPIIFSGPMVRAILDGKKTQTRRVIKPQPEAHLEPNLVVAAWDAGFIDVKCPYGRAETEDRLWVREAWMFTDWTEEGEPWIGYRANHATAHIPAERYDVEWGERLSDIWADLSGTGGVACDKRWRSPIHMPRWASRITLEIAEVRVQRVQDISHHDALAEGVDYDVSAEDGAPVAQYRKLWDFINGKRGPWDSNPWVWAISFRRVE